LDKKLKAKIRNHYYNKYCGVCKKITAHLTYRKGECSECASRKLIKEANESHVN